MKWKFDSYVAENFNDIAHKNIQDYNQIIQKSIDIIGSFASKNDPIIDVGCATGNTLLALKKSGFANITGVDNSQDMINQCRIDSELIVSDTFPKNKKYKGVICNWTLHFIKSKKKRKQYLKDIFKGLKDGGVLVLTEKVKPSKHSQLMYNKFKWKMGMSFKDIERKEKQLKDVLIPLHYNWYIKTLSNIGFEVEIVDAAYCFMTFMCVKKSK